MVHSGSPRHLRRLEATAQGRVGVFRFVEDSAPGVPPGGFSFARTGTGGRLDDRSRLDSRWQSRNEALWSSSLSRASLDPRNVRYLESMPRYPRMDSTLKVTTRGPSHHPRLHPHRRPPLAIAGLCDSRSPPAQYSIFQVPEPLRRALRPILVFSPAGCFTAGCSTFALGLRRCTREGGHLVEWMAP